MIVLRQCWLDWRLCPRFHAHIRHNNIDLGKTEFSPKHHTNRTTDAIPMAYAAGALTLFQLLDWMGLQRQPDSEWLHVQCTIDASALFWCGYILIFLNGLTWFIFPHSCSCLTHLPRRQNGSYFADDIFKCIFLHENAWISVGFSPDFVPKGPIGNYPALVQIMAWRRKNDKPLSEPILTRFTDGYMRH